MTSTHASTALLAALVYRQREGGLTDQAMADRLGVSKALWILTRQGHRQVRWSVLRGALRAYPELSFFLQPDVTHSTPDVTEVHESPVEEPA